MIRPAGFKKGLSFRREGRGLRLNPGLLESFELFSLLKHRPPFFCDRAKPPGGKIFPARSLRNRIVALVVKRCLSPFRRLLTGFFNHASVKSC
jgi:hypothetical protein